MTKYLYLIKALLLGAGWGYVASSMVGQCVGADPFLGTRFFWMIIPLTIFMVVTQFMKAPQVKEDS